MSDLRKKYAKLFQDGIDNWFDQGIDFSFTEDDILSPEGGIRHDSRLLLGHYRPRTIEEYFRRFRIARIFKLLGIPEDISTDLDLSDPYLHKFTIYTRDLSDDYKILELFFRNRSLPVPSIRQKDKRAECLYVDWMMMQNPYAEFSAKKPALPGQKHPGLRIGNHILEILFHVAKRIRSDGLANSPNYLHTAVLFSKEFMFIDPKVQAISEGTKGYLLKRYSLWTVAWAAVHGAVKYLDDDRPLLWESSPMILPISQVMKNYFNSRWYKQAYREAKDAFRVRIDFDLLNEKTSSKTPE